MENTIANCLAQNLKIPINRPKLQGAVVVLVAVVAVASAMVVALVAWVQPRLYLLDRLLAAFRKSVSTSPLPKLMLPNRPVY
ncbi:MAG: hypothetical protein WB689_11665 [Xanthobacteraceae bacterium]